MPITATPYTAVYGPLSLPGVTCLLWLDGADTTTITGTSPVTQWRDKSGGGFNAASASTGPTYNTSGNYMTFNGSSQYLTTSLTVSANSHCLIAVWNPTTVSATSQGNTSVFRFQAGPYIIFPYMSGASPKGYVTSFDGTTINYANSPLLENSVAGQTTIGIANIASNTQAVYRNGGTPTTATATISSGTSDSLTIGVGNNEYFQGNIYEMIIYSTALSISQRQSIEGYLAQKWGLTSSLPAGHPGLTQTLYNGRVYQSRVPLALSFAVYYNNPTTFATGCQLWLDAADSTTVTGTTTVTAWRDKSGRGYNLTPGAGTTSYANSGITINSSYLYGAGAVNLTTFTFFIVAKNIGTTYNQPFFSARPNTTATFSSTDGFGWYMDYGTQTRFFGRYPTTSEYITITGLNTLVTAVYSVTGTRDGLFTQWNSGTQVGTATYTTRTSTAQGFSVGGEWDGTTWYTYTNSGTIYEVIVYNTVLTTTQRQSVEGYLTKKWALAASLPAGNLGLTSTYVNPTWEATIPYGVNRSQPIVATGGTITYSGNFKIHTFTTVGNTNFQITQPSITQIQVLVVGGGGSGGACTGGGGGGGGAAFVGSQTISQGTYTVTVGAGGVPSAVDPYQGSNGGNSSFNSIIGIGGGTGGIYQGSFTYGAGSNGGCGGGACGPSSAVGLPLQSGGYAGGTAATGGPGGGGGGMGSVGSNATLPLGASSWVGGNGGNGGSYTIGGATYVVSGGGGGGSFNAGTGSAAGTGGTGGGGNGSISTVGGNATYYGGGGGGSCGGVQLPGGNGYQGVVIIAYNYL